MRSANLESRAALPLFLSLSLGVEWERERERTKATVDRFAVRREEGGRAPPRPARGCACARGIGTSSSSSSSDRKAEDDESDPNKDRCLHLAERSSVRVSERASEREIVIKERGTWRQGQMTGER